MKKEKQSCPECQFENGKHSFECSRYKQEEWEARKEAGEKPFDKPQEKDKFGSKTDIDGFLKHLIRF